MLKLKQLIGLQSSNLSVRALGRFPDPEPAVQFICPDANSNPRLKAQRGLFSRHTFDLQKWLDSAYLGVDYAAVLYRFLIPNTERERCLNDLEAMNIHDMTLLPDAAGVASYCNRKLDLMLGIEGMRT